MTLKYVLSVFAAALFGYTISPTYSQEAIFCNGFENCPEGNLALEARVAALEALLANVTRGQDPNTEQDTLTFTAMNLQLVSGSGATEGPVNGTGNLLIGYNELRGGDETDDRSGSHMLVIGRLNNYSSYGGMVVGFFNATSGDHASVSGGTGNTASKYASVSGGNGNTASGDYASVSGGLGNIASGERSSVSGGTSNTASGFAASVSGGNTKIATAHNCTVAGNIGTDCL